MKTKKMKTILTTTLLLFSIIAFSQDAPKKLEGLAYIPTLYVDASNTDAIYKLKSQIETHLLPIGAAVKMLPLVDSTMLDIRTWQLEENKKWEVRVRAKE